MPTATLPSEMDALVLTGPGAFELRKVPVPEPGPMEILCRVHSIAIDTGTDSKLIAGVFRDAWGWPPYYPITIGHEWAGEVIAQGAVGVETRINDRIALDYLRPLNDAASARRVAAERALLAALDGSCRTPIAALAQFDGPETLTLRGRVATLDGTIVHDVARRGPAGEAEAMGDDAGRELRAVAGPNFFA